MAFFKEVHCRDCGKKVSFLKCVRIADNTAFCPECLQWVPEGFELRVKEMDYDEYLNLKNFKKYSDENFKPIFNEAFCYRSVHLDKEHGLFYIGSDINDEKVMVLDCGNVQKASFEFHPEEIKNRIINSTVKGYTLLDLINKNPPFWKDYTLDRELKVKGENKKFGKKVIFELPDDYEIMKNEFLSAVSEKKALYSDENE